MSTIKTINHHQQKKYLISQNFSVRILNANGLILILFGEKRDDVMLDVRLGVEDHDELNKSFC
jgi:hypothetical protein